MQQLAVPLPANQTSSIIQRVAVKKEYVDVVYRKLWGHHSSMDMRRVTRRTIRLCHIFQWRGARHSFLLIVPKNIEADTLKSDPGRRLDGTIVTKTICCLVIQLDFHVKGKKQGVHGEPSGMFHTSFQKRFPLVHLRFISLVLHSTKVPKKEFI